MQLQSYTPPPTPPTHTHTLAEHSHKSHLPSNTHTPASYAALEPRLPRPPPPPTHTHTCSDSSFCDILPPVGNLGFMLPPK